MAVGPLEPGVCGAIDALPLLHCEPQSDRMDVVVENAVARLEARVRGARRAIAN